MNNSLGTTVTQSIFGTYSADSRDFDEMMGPDGAMRAPWKQYAQFMERLGVSGVQYRYEQARALIDENGVSYNVYGDAQDTNRPWSIDLIPQIISEQEWSGIEQGISQRATLLDLLLRDIYGPQKFLRARQMPPEFIYANPAFLRPRHGVNGGDRQRLSLYAVDLARERDGNWMVAADRTQAPSGAGYALENRLVTTRLFPDISRDFRVRRLATFFERFRTRLRELAPSNRDNPMIVLLSPGPAHETYFEHSYLARYLGFTLVEDEDLAVRDNCVFLKTLEGLTRIDVILRRVDDQICDPLEFGTESASGLVGLMQAVHAGNVAVSNPLGSGILEAPALRALLPSLCKAALGEELRLPSVRTWWCADPEHLRYVIAHFNELLIAPAFSGRGWNPVVVENLAGAERDQLLATIRLRPFDYVAQERIHPSTVPVWKDGTLKPHYMMLRTYAVAAQDNGYSVMPGGLTRYSESRESLVISMQRGGGSKDTWVQTSGPVDHYSLLPPPGQRIEIKRTVSNLPSRTADNLYWLGRYLERVEATIRTVRCILSRLTDEYGTGSGKELPALVRSLALVLPCGPTHDWFRPDLDLNTVERQAISALFDRTWVNSVSTVFAALNHVAWVVRDRLSLDTWRVLSRLVEDLPEYSDQAPHAGEVVLLLNHLITGLAAFSGLARENMTRGQGWRFLDIGRRVERSINTLELIRSGLVIPIEPENSVLQAVLEISDSAMTYRSRYGANMQTPAVLDLLMTDELNPRALAYQIGRLAGHIEALPRERQYPFASREQQFVTRLSADLRLVDIFELSTVGVQNKRASLETSVLDWSKSLRDISDALAWHYFSHTEFSRQVTAFRKDRET